MKMRVRQDIATLNQFEPPWINDLMLTWAGVEITGEWEATGNFYGGRGGLNFYWLSKWLEPAQEEVAYLNILESL